MRPHEFWGHGKNWANLINTHPKHPSLSTFNIIITEDIITMPKKNPAHHVCLSLKEITISKIKIFLEKNVW